MNASTSEKMSEPALPVDWKQPEVEDPTRFILCLQQLLKTWKEQGHAGKSRHIVTPTRFLTVSHDDKVLPIQYRATKHGIHSPSTRGKPLTAANAKIATNWPWPTSTPTSRSRHLCLGQARPTAKPKMKEIGERSNDGTVIDATIEVKNSETLYLPRQCSFLFSGYPSTSDAWCML